MSAPSPAAPPAASGSAAAPASVSAFTVDVPTLADVPALARVHVRSWEVAYGHVLAGEEWFGQPAIERRIEQWTRWLTPGAPEADEGAFRAGRDGDGTPVGLAASRSEEHTSELQSH